jgi:hypothetical protein
LRFECISMLSWAGDNPRDRAFSANIIGIEDMIALWPLCPWLGRQYQYYLGC